MIGKNHTINCCAACGCYNGKDDPENKISFSCSELVALVYKIMGVFTDDRPAAQYIPGSFEGPSINQKITGGAYLGNELLVDFFLRT